MIDQTMKSYIGLSAAAAYTRLLLANSQVRRVSVYHYSSPPPLQQRIKQDAIEDAVIAQALSLRADTGLPFWNSLFAACLSSGNYTTQLIDAAFFHGGPGRRELYDRQEIQAGALERLVGKGASNLSLSSEVEVLDGGSRHLPLLDFHCEVSPENEELASLICARLMPQGYLLIDSGDSYHACGFELLTAQQRVVALGKALLVAPIVDSHYIAHQLQQESSSLRISTGGKATRGPVVVRASGPR